MKTVILAMMLAFSCDAFAQRMPESMHDPIPYRRMNIAGNYMVQASRSRIASFCVLGAGGIFTSIIAIKGNANDQRTAVGIAGIAVASFTTLQIVAIFRDRKAGKHLTGGI